MQIATGLIIAARVWSNGENLPESYKYEIRIGVHQGADLMVQDVNGKDNLCGAAINDTQRIMSQADGQQIIVSKSVFDVLKATDDYIGHFRGFTARNKHGEDIPVFQYINPKCIGLSTKEPQSYLDNQPLNSHCRKCKTTTKQRVLHSRRDYYTDKRNKNDKEDDIGVECVENSHMLECENCQRINFRFAPWNDWTPEDNPVYTYPPT